MLTDQMDAVTNDYFIIKGGKAQDIYFETSFNLNYFIKQKNGIWKRPSGGRRMRIPLRYDGNEAGFYGRGDTVSSDKRDAITAAYFDMKHAFGNATILRIDTLENAGPQAMINLVTEEVAGAQMSITKLLADSQFDLPSGASTKRLTGMRAALNENADLEYGDLTENEVMAVDGTKPWEGKMEAAGTVITLDVIRNGRSDADGGMGVQDEPDLIIQTKALYNKTKSLLQAQQRFTTEGAKTVKAGFTGVYFEGADLYPERYLPADHMLMINSQHWGYAVHQKGLFVRTPWSVIEGSAQDKTMKILFDGNQVCNNRKVHKGWSNCTVS